MGKVADTVATELLTWLPIERRVLVACSGGADSTALAHAAARVGRCAAIGHVDHGLRPESAHEAERVRALANELGVPFFVEKVEGLSTREWGLEAAAREARYPALARLAAKAGAQLVATAHTRRDQAETILLRLIRGAGPGALSGVRRSRQLADGIDLIRPLLDVSREATEAYCRENHLAFIDDPHNRDPRRSRAKLRAIWPELLELNPRLEEALSSAAELFGEEDRLLEELSKGELQRLQPPLQRRALLRLANEKGLRPARQHLDAVRELLRRGEGSVDLPAGYARAEGGSVEFRAGRRPVPLAPIPLAVAGPGRYAWNSRELVVSGKGAGQPVDLQRAPFPWTLRSRRRGDRFRPLHGRTRKLSDWLIDAGVPRERREELAVLEDARGQVFFVEGLRPSEAMLEAPDVAHFQLHSEMNAPAGSLGSRRHGESGSATMDPRPDREPQR